MEWVEKQRESPIDNQYDTSVPLQNIIESILFAVKKPMTIAQLIAVLPEEKAITADEIQTTLNALTAEYQSRGIELIEVASGYRFQIKNDVVPWVHKLWSEKPPKYGRSFLETLAIITYKQPVTRGEIEEVRGVSVSSHIMRTLQEREWIRIIGYREVPGRPAMYATTRQFLDYFNLKSLKDLPEFNYLSEKILSETTLLDDSKNNQDMTEQAIDRQSTTKQALTLVDLDLAKNFKEQADEADQVIFSSLDELLSTVKTDFVDSDLSEKDNMNNESMQADQSDQSDE
ncbi:MAG: SMC-Scp complex subunit ScpB [Endozoicomonadaceae bacterium]|nr:SMC-Scp complex subunit ScpB [Endozoicomonadaceae bacterium]